MNKASLNGGPPHKFATTIRLEGFEVSCVAANPFRSGFAFGSDDGKVKFTDEAGVTLMDMNGSPSGEAINGIASIANTIAVSSRQEVMLRILNPKDPTQVAALRVPCGAHGITATPGGYYVAPLGGSGIMMMLASSGHGDAVGVMMADKQSMYFYRVLAGPGKGGKDLLICAARQGGIGIAQVGWGDGTDKMRTATFPELDAIDVCFVGGGPEAPALAAVGRDGSLILARDMLHDEKPLTMKFDTIAGRAYRLLSARGHLFLLTSSALYGLMNLGTRMLQGLPSAKFTTPIFVAPLGAVDASLVADRWLLVVMPDGVLRFDLDLIHDNVPQDIRQGETREAIVETLAATGETIAPAWEFADIQTESRELAGAF